MLSRNQQKVHSANIGKVPIFLERCAHCGKQARALGVLRDKTTHDSFIWCAECLFFAWKERAHVLAIHRISCSHCDTKVVLSYHIKWGESYHSLCEECMLEIERVQRAQGNVVDPQ